MDTFINFNGKMVKAGSPVITADNRGFRYGDGLFETMKAAGGQLFLKEFHLDRLFSGISQLLMPMPASFNRGYITKQILNTCIKNNIASTARVRLTVFRGDGGLYDTTDSGGGFLIQTWEMPAANLRFNENGLAIGIYYGIRKSCDSFSNLKSNNYLPYIMGALFAKQERWNDCLILNTYDRICDATIANVFWIKDRRLFTPPLSEGCVAGVMRRFLLEEFPKAGYIIEEKAADPAVLEDADEIFLTNAAYGIRWISSLNNKKYGHEMTGELYRRFIAPHQ